MVAACRLGRKRRLVRTLEWLTLLPLTGRLPQIAHCWDTVDYPFLSEGGNCDPKLGAAA
jgi:hypothetical protein